MKDCRQIFRKSLKVQMAKADVSAEQLALKANVSVDSVRQYLRGETAPLFETVIKIASALGCTPNDLANQRD